MLCSRIAVVTAFALVLSSLAMAADISGKWTGTMDNGGPASFTLKLDGKTVTGTMVGADGKDYPISEGKLADDNISFTVNSEWQGQPVKLLVTGKVSGDQMQVHIAADNGYWSANAALKHDGN
jgi:hypothetical protein